MKKVLIFYTSIGQGHKTIAENIGWHLERAGMEVKLVDSLKNENKLIDKLATGVYKKMIQWFPFFWNWLYVSAFVHKITTPLRVPLAGGQAKETLRVIDEFKPDLVITTQIVSSAAVSGLKTQGLFKGLFAIALSDFHFHPMWAYSNADAYLVNIQEQKDELISMGVNKKSIFVCGITLKYETKIDVAEIKNKLGINTEEKVVLVSAGSQGYFFPEVLVRELASLQNIKVLVVCGNNDELSNKLELEYRESKNIKVFGYYSPMAELYVVTDLFLTKPGGLSVAEALQNNLPILITHSMPGQESLNTQYLTKKHLVLDLQNLGISEIVIRIKEDLASSALKIRLGTTADRKMLVDLDLSEPRVVKAVKALFHGL